MVGLLVLYICDIIRVWKTKLRWLKDGWGRGQ